MLGAGTGRGSLVDGELILDENGLPFFPGRRFKGLLRESGIEVLEMLTQSGLANLFAHDILELTFGTKTTPAGIRVNNFYLCGKADANGEQAQGTFDYQDIKIWLDYLQSEQKRDKDCQTSTENEYKDLFSKEAILQALTQVRFQTAINEKGFAEEGSLRTTRLLKRNFIFNGKIEITEKEFQTEIENLLVLALLNLRRVGTSRNRGWGTVTCQVYKSDNLAEELGQKMAAKLRDLDEKDLTFKESIGEDEEIQLDERDNSLPRQDEAKDWAFLPYEITNLSPLLFTAPAGDENMVSTLDYIPGAALRGFYANQLISKKGLAPATTHLDEEFRTWFLTEGLFFSNGYPMTLVGDKKWLHHPTPIFLHQCKKGEKPYNLYGVPPEETTKGIGGYLTVDGTSVKKFTPKKTVNFHLVKSKGKTDHQSRIDGNMEEGGIFHYEAIETGQNFYGYIGGPKGKLIAFQQRLGHINNIRIGRSINTQYGKGKISFMEIVNNLADVYNERENSLFPHKNTDNICEINKGEIFLYLVSPLLLTNEWGFYSADEDNLTSFLEKQLGVAQIQVKKRFAEAERSQTFASHLRIHEPEVRGWAGGTTFLLEFKDKDGIPVEIDKQLEDKLNRMQAQGIGSKKELGYGQITLSNTLLKHLTFEKVNSQTKEIIDEPKSNLPPLVGTILKEIYQENLNRLTARAALDKAADYNFGGGNLSNSLIGRLNNICQNSTSEKDFVANLKQLQDQAKRALKRFRAVKKPVSIYDELIEPDLNRWLNGALKTTWVKLGKLDELAKRHNVVIKTAPDYKFFWRLFFNNLRKLQKNDT